MNKQMIAQSHLISARFITNCVQCIFSPRQATRKRKQQHRYVPNIIDIGPEFRRVAGPNFLCHFEGHIVTERLICRAFFGQHCLLGLEDFQFFA